MASAVKSGKVKSTPRRKTFAIGGFSQCDELAGPPPDSLEMFNIIGELADIVQQTDGRQGSVSKVDEELSTQEIYAHLSRDYSTTSRSDTPVEVVCEMQNITQSEMHRSLQAETMGIAQLTRSLECESIHEHSDVTQGKQRVPKSYNQVETNHSSESTVPFKNTMSSPDRNPSCLIPLVGSETGSSSMSGLSYSLLEIRSKFYEPSEVLTVNSESVSQSLSTQDIGHHDHPLCHTKLVENEMKNKKLSGDSSRLPTSYNKSEERTTLTQDSHQMETEQTKWVEESRHCKERKGSKGDSESTNSISDEMLMQVRLPKTQVETSRQGVTSSPQCFEGLSTQPNLEDGSSASDLGMV